MDHDGRTSVMEPPARNPRTPDAAHRPASGPSATLDDVLDELRMLRREQQHEDFSFARLAAAVAQAFALCAIGWGLFAWIDAAPDQIGPAATAATIRLLAGIAFQVMALTLFVASKK
ncbi:MAG: hypothetical protein DCC65_06165 [Planctomycetota bacterium]|nr:MAG: hypothetical protein DCC65_06165 [Planctomycetota bacterium]